MTDAGPEGAAVCPTCGRLVLAGYEGHVERCRREPADGERVADDV